MSPVGPGANPPEPAHTPPMRQGAARDCGLAPKQTEPASCLITRPSRLGCLLLAGCGFGHEALGAQLLCPAAGHRA